MNTESFQINCGSNQSITLPGNSNAKLFLSISANLRFLLTFETGADKKQFEWGLLSKREGAQQGKCAKLP